MSERDFETLRRVTVDSAVWRQGRAAAGVWSSAVTESFVARAARHGLGSVAQWPAADRLRAAAISVAAAVASHYGLGTMTPRYAGSAVPGLLWLIVAAAALVVAARPQAFVEAWAGSIVVRLARRLARRSSEREGVGEHGVLEPHHPPRDPFDDRDVGPR